MHRSYCVLLALWCLQLGGCGAGDPPVKALTGATLLDGTGKTIPDAIVIVSGADIQAAGPRVAVTVPAGAKRVDEKGKFIMPGLIDVRVRLDADPAKALAELHSFLAAGITSIGMVDGGPATSAGMPRVLPATQLAAGFADEVISSNGASPSDTYRKIDRMAKAEIAPAQILSAATLHGAVWLKQMRLGAIQPGKKADLLVLSADPLHDAANLHKVERVMLDGKWVK